MSLLCTFTLYLRDLARWFLWHCFHRHPRDPIDHVDFTITT